MMDLVDCQHCKKTGTCTNGPDGQSCARCIAFFTGRHEYSADSGKPIGLVCSVCWGKGLAELSSSKWNYRYPALLAIVFVLLAFLLLFVFGLLQYQHFDKLLVFVSTLIGSITGYYFGGERAKATIHPVTPVSPKNP